MPIQLRKLIPYFFLLVFLGACKKDKAPFVAETELTTVKESLKTSNRGGFTIQGMDIDPKRSILYFYEIPANGSGFLINAYNIATKNYSTVFEHRDANWKNSNGSEGQRIRVADDRLYVQGGFTNTQIVVLKGLESNGLSLDRTIVIQHPYDIAFTDSRGYVLSGLSSAGIVSFPKNDPAQQSNMPFGAGQEPVSHGSSGVIVPVGGTPHLFRSTQTRIELRTLENNFVKSVVNSANYPSKLQKDEQNRVYHITQNKITRYSADLSNQEEFPCKDTNGSHSTYVFALKNDGNHYSLYFKAADRLSVVKLPK